MCLRALFWILIVLLVGDLMALMAFNSLKIMAGAGALVALITLVWNIRRQYSEDFLKESQVFLEKSFDTLNVLDDKGWPKNDRMRWLTSARLLRVVEQMGGKINLKSHKLLYEDIKDYWRSKFYDLIEPDGQGFPETYFAVQPEDLDAYSGRGRAPLNLSSVAVIYRFIRWPEGRSDPIGDEPKFSEKEIDRMCKFGPRGLGDLLRKHRALHRQEPYLHRSK